MKDMRVKDSPNHHYEFDGVTILACEVNEDLSVGAIDIYIDGNCHHVNIDTTSNEMNLVVAAMFYVIANRVKNAEEIE